ncbi:MAG: hypothetical protein ACE5HD_09855 [Acidobacteriota bacterium]
MDLAPLEIQGEGGRMAIDLMNAHGGLRHFLDLDDLEYSVRVDTYDSSGELIDVVRQLHRFEAAPPTRYLLDHLGDEVREFGLVGGEGWMRIGDSVRRDQTASRAARRELSILNFLYRAPFSLADPGVRVAEMSELPARRGRPLLKRLAVESHPPGAPETRRYVFLLSGADGRLQGVLFKAVHSDAADPPMRLARALDFITLNGVDLVSRWSLLPADGLSGEVSGPREMEWTVEESHWGNRFTDSFYRNGTP